MYDKYAQTNSLTPGGRWQGVKSKSLCNGMMYVLELPILSCKVLGEVKYIDESGSKNCELHLHFANMKPPESFNFGNASCNNSRNSSPEQSTSSTTIFFPQAQLPTKHLSLYQ